MHYRKHGSTIAGTAVLAAVPGGTALVAPGGAEPTLFVRFLVVLSTPFGQICVANLLFVVAAFAVRSMQWFVFGRLRVAEWQRLWDRLINYTMGQLVIVGAVVEPDLAELLLWSCFTAVVGVIGIYSGLCRSRVKVLPWQCPRLALLRARLAIQLGTPRKRPAHWASSQCLGWSS